MRDLFLRGRLIMHSLAVMAGLVPSIPIRWSAALQSTGITGTRPVMT
jgi:hypothetical protein